MEENNEKIKIIRIVVLFGDFTAFTLFCQAVTNDAIELDPFMEEYDKLIDQTETETGYVIEDTGDGFMCTVELPPDGKAADYAAKAIFAVWDLSLKIEELIKNKVMPSPSGFRVAGAAGYVTRKVRKSGKIVLRGKQINLANGLLEIGRPNGFICHESLKSLITKKEAEKHAMEFTPITGDTWMLRIHRR